MLTREEQAVIDRLKEKGKKIEADYKAGLVTEEKYQEYHKLLDEAANKIETMSSKV